MQQFNFNLTAKNKRTLRKVLSLIKYGTKELFMFTMLIGSVIYAAILFVLVVTFLFKSPNKLPDLSTEVEVNTPITTTIKAEQGQEQQEAIKSIVDYLEAHK